MPLPVSLKEVVGQLEMANDQIHAYVNRKTGEIVVFSHDTYLAAESDDPPEPEWEPDDWQDCNRVLRDADFIKLPSQYDLNEYQIIKRFCQSRDNKRERELLLDAIAGRGAFRMFKNAIHRQGIEQDWYRYRDEAFREIAADFLEAHGIAFTDDAKREPPIAPASTFLPEVPAAPESVTVSLSADAAQVLHEWLSRFNAQQARKRADRVEQRALAELSEALELALKGLQEPSSR